MTYLSCYTTKNLKGNSKHSESASEKTSNQLQIQFEQISQSSRILFEIWHDFEVQVNSKHMSKSFRHFFRVRDSPEVLNLIDVRNICEQTTN